MMPDRWCLFCGRRADDCPGGVWHVKHGEREGICVYCARAALRALDPTMPPAVVMLDRRQAEPQFRSRRARELLGTDGPDAA